MTSTTQLEEQFRNAEQKRKETEDARASGLPVPGSPKETLMQIEELRRTLSDMLEAKAFQRVSQVLNLEKTVLETIEKLREFASEIQEQSTLTSQTVDLMNKITGQLDALDRLWRNEIADRKKQRELEAETLQKLNRYLENWL